jgi:hypothetical protein
MTDTQNQEQDKSHLLHLPIEKKIDLVQQIYIRSEDIDHAWEVLNYNMRYAVRRGEASTSYIIGYSRCSKTESAKRWIKHVCGKRPVKGGAYQMIEGNGKRVVYADLTNGSTPFIATCQILKKLFNDITVNKLTETTAAERLVEQFIFHGVDQFIIDEGQRMFVNKGPAAIAKFAAWLVSIENARSFGTVVMGDTRLFELFEGDDAANQRKTGLAYLEPFPFVTPEDELTFEGFVVEFERMLPLLKTPITNGTGRCTPLMLLMLYFATRGVRGAFAKLCERALHEADIRLGGKNVDAVQMEDFSTAFNFLLKNDPLMMGVNPFKIDDRRKLPSFPLAPGKTNGAPASQASSARRTRSKTGGRILAKS